ncbi:hypothetical protein ACSFA2_08470 [Variovorax sp. LT2P21]|uniref:hypothetical protein n=1 Tax=Variovorax sp. LT2P21 TaxID=3443731 RepID=UPI003F485636
MDESKFGAAQAGPALPHLPTHEAGSRLRTSSTRRAAGIGPATAFNVPAPATR